MALIRVFFNCAFSILLFTNRLLCGILLPIENSRSCAGKRLYHGKLWFPSREFTTLKGIKWPIGSRVTGAKVLGRQVLDSEKKDERSRTKGDEDFRSLQQNHLMQCWAPQRRYEPIAVDKAEDCWIHTTDGRRIFDLRSAHECINLGFRHPKILKAMREQMESVVYVTDDFATRPTAQLAKTLATITPGDPNKRVWFELGPFR